MTWAGFTRRLAELSNLMPDTYPICECQSAHISNSDTRYGSCIIRKTKSRLCPLLQLTTTEILQMSFCAHCTEVGGEYTMWATNSTTPRERNCFSSTLFASAQLSRAIWRVIFSSNTLLLIQYLYWFRVPDNSAGYPSGVYFWEFLKYVFEADVYPSTLKI